MSQLLELLPNSWSLLILTGVSGGWESILGETLYFCSAPMTFPYILYRDLLLAAAGSKMVGKMDLFCFLVWYSVFHGLKLASSSSNHWDLTNWAMKRDY